MVLLALAWMSTSSAGSLDLLEVGGVWGTPAATNPTAVWWNPAGLAVGGKTQFLIEGAPVFATVKFDRYAPDYGPPGDLDEDGEPIASDTPYDYSGSEELKLTAVIPFLGVQSNFGVKGLGVGAALYVPYALGGRVGDKPPTYEELLNDKKGSADYPDSAGSYFLRDGNIQAVYTTLAASYHIAEKVSVGVSGSYVDSTWYAVTDVETLSTLEASGGSLFWDLSQSEQLFEHPDYRSTLTFDHLKAHAFTFGTGLYITPVDGLGISVAYNHGMRLDHTGNVMVTTGCPPDEDGFGAHEAIEGLGLCNATTPGTTTVGYRLPSRMNVGVVIEAVDGLRLEPMGGWVGWSAFTDYEIQTRVKPDAVPDAANPEATAALISQDRLWARGAKNSFWVGVDAKGEVVPEKFTLGGRVIFDKAAIPDGLLASNNYDADRLNLGAMAAVGPFGPIQIGASFGHQILFERDVKNSDYGVSLGDDRNEDRFYYPSSAGKYKGGISRIGVSVLGVFGKDAD